MIKSTKGFTLVELIVVIAILAILAGVAIPVYNGYINKAADAAFVTELDAIASAAQAANAIEGSISTIEVTEGGIKVTATKLAEDYDTDFVLYYPNATADADASAQGGFVFKDAPDFPKTYENGATWGATGWEAKPAA